MTSRRAMLSSSASTTTRRRLLQHLLRCAAFDKQLQSHNSLGREWNFLRLISQSVGISASRGLCQRASLMLCKCSVILNTGVQR